MSVLSLVSMIVIVSCGTVLVWHEKYNDGLLGRIGIAGMVFVSLLLLLERVAGQDHYLSPLTVCFQASVAVFFARHTYNFLLWAYRGRGAWKRASHDHA